MKSVYGLFLLSNAVLSALIFGIGNVSGHQHGKLEGQGVLKGTQIQAEFFLYFFKTVDKSVSVDIKLPGGLGQIQVVLKESPDDRKSFAVNSISQRDTGR